MVNGVRLFAGEDKAEAVGGVRRLGVEPSALLSDASLARMRLAHTAVHCLRKLVEAMNRLGVVWAAQESSASALDTLRGAQSLFREERALLKPSPESGPRSDDSDSDSSAGDRAELEQQHTMTLFYMAQVYGAMRRPGLSARCCHLTLARQCGEDATLSRKEWIEAAFGLAKYYASNRRFAAAAECLAACDAVAKKQPVPKAGTDDRKRDAELELRASVHRAWAELYCTLLRAGRVRTTQQAVGAPDDALEGGVDSDTDEESGGEEEEEGEGGEGTAATTREQRRARRRKRKQEEQRELTEFLADRAEPLFPALAGEAARPSVPESEAVNGVETAKPLLTRALAHAKRATDFFVLDGFVSTHCGIQQTVAALYRELAWFEPSLQRRIAIHRRRLQTLAPLADQLSVSAYRDLLKQLRYSAAWGAHDAVQALVTTVERREELGGPRTTPQERAKCDKLCAEAIGAFRTFLRLFEDQDGDGGKAQKEAEEKSGVKGPVVESTNERAFLQAHLEIARMRGKMHGTSARERVDAVKESYDHLKWLKTYAEARMDTSAFREELDMVDEMLTLLPGKLDRLSAGYAL